MLESRELEQQQKLSALFTNFYELGVDLASRALETDSVTTEFNLLSGQAGQLVWHREAVQQEYEYSDTRLLGGVRITEQTSPATVVINDYVFRYDLNGHVRPILWCNTISAKSGRLLGYREVSDSQDLARVQGYLLELREELLPIN